MAGFRLNHDILTRFSPFVIAWRKIESIGNLFPFEITGITLTVIIGGDKNLYRITIILHGRTELEGDFFPFVSTNFNGRADEPVFISVSRTFSITIHISISYALVFSMLPPLITISIVSREHTQFNIKVFKENGINVFCRSLSRRISSIGLVVDVGSTVGIREDGKMISSTALQATKGYSLSTISHVLGKVTVGNGSAVGGNGDVARGS